MSDQHHERLKSIFAEVSELSEDDRRRRVDDLCAGDDVLRAELESLLRHDAHPRIDFDDATILTAPEHVDVETIGPYRITDVLGRGGMGIVYQAEQVTPRRTVALKLIRPGMIHDETLKRFTYEAELLGRLQHPGIAQIFEVGTAALGDAGEQPYFTMELVRGEPLTEYAARRRLSRSARLQLLIRTCEAVQYAHQNGVIHRDLKPSNIIVSDPPSEPGQSDVGGRVGQPKILDFGVARSIVADGHTVMTMDGQLVGTLDYMSPEQSSGRGRDIDVRSDVYALGVIAYQLLTDRLPFDTSEDPLPEAVRRIAEETPPRLSSIDRSLRGDLETIIGKAMEKDATRRYQSASEFAADLGRYTRDEPVLARPPSAVYQMRKFARRHRGVFTVSMILALAVITGTIVSTTGWVQALAQTRRADTEKQTTAAINDFLTRMLNAADPSINADPDLRVRVVLDRAAARIGTDFPDRPLVRAGLHAVIGRTYTSLGLHDVAREHLTTALELRRDAIEPDEEAIRDNLHDLGMNEKHADRYVDALAWLEEVRDADLVAYGPDDVRTLNAQTQVAAMMSVLGRLDEATALFDEVLPRWHAVEPDGSSLLGVALNDYGLHLASCGDAHGAIEQHLASMAMHETYDGPESLPVSLEHVNLAGALNDIGRYDEALEHVERGRAIRAKRLDPGHPLLISLDHIEGFIQYQLGEVEAAAALFQASIDAHRPLLPDHAVTLATSLKSLGDVRSLQERRDEAIALLEEAAELLSGTVGTEHSLHTAVLNSLAGAYQSVGRIDDARATIEQAIEISRSHSGPASFELAAMMHMQATIEMNVGEYALARDRFQEAFDMLLEVDPTNTELKAYFYQNIAVVSGRLGDLDGALDGLQQALALRQESLPPDHPGIASTLQNIGAIYRMLERYDEAAAAAREAYDIWSVSFADEHPQKAACLVVEGASLHASGRSAEAIAPLMDGLAMRQALFDDQSLQVAEARLELGLAFVAMQRLDEAMPLLNAAADVLDRDDAPEALRKRCQDALDGVSAPE